MTASLIGYQLHELIHQSSISRVYRAMRKADSHPVIVKTQASPTPTPEQMARFKLEFDIVSSFDDPKIITALHAERQANYLALIFEDFGGISLSKHLANHGAFDISTVLNLAIQITLALEIIHHQGIIHKDINPANLVWNQNTNQLKIIDFGIASKLSKERKPSHHLEGSLPYIAPEQTGRMNRNIDYRADFYSLGATLYELCSAQRPFPFDDPMALIHAHIAQLVEPLTHIPQPLFQIIAKLLSKAAEDRYQSIHGLLHDLRECQRQWESKNQIEPFLIAEKDAADRFIIPEKLYGREEQIHLLNQAYGNMRKGKSEVILIAGYAGIGKTSLVQEIHKLMSEGNGVFISGKFDQRQRQTPYSAFLQAFSELFQQVLTQPDVEKWQKRVRDAVYPNGDIIIEAIPEAKLIIGEVPCAAKLDAQEAEHRFNNVFENFVAALPTQDHPIVLFVDDLQWADEASLNLLKLISGNNGIKHLLLIGAYRDNELYRISASSHANALLNCSILTNIKLEPLEQEHITQLLCDTLHQDPSKDLQKLSLVCTQKTGGNPFYLNQFLEMLYQERHIYFSDNRWQWNLQEITNLDATDDLADLLSKRLKKLQPNAQTLLQLASCIGNRFGLSELALISGKDRLQVSIELWDPLQEGLIIPSDNDWQLIAEWSEVDVTYQFLHDRVQQTAYALFDDDTLRQKAHLDIGRRMLQKAKNSHEPENIFQIIDQLNAGIQFIDDQEEQNHLIDLNLIAGKRALGSNAYVAAFEYLKTGIQLSGHHAWANNFKRTWELYLHGASAAHMCSAFDVNDQYIDALLQRTPMLMDRLPAIEIRLQSYFVRKNFQEATHLGLGILKQLGLPVPKNPSMATLLFEIQYTRFVMRNVDPYDFIEHKPMTEPLKLAALKLLATIATPAVLTSPNIFVVLICRALRFCMKHGNAPETALLFPSFGFIIGGISSNFKRGYAFGDAGLQFQEKYGRPALAPMTSFIFNCNIYFWNNDFLPYQEMETLFRKAMDHGDLETAGNSLLCMAISAFSQGVELSQLVTIFHECDQRAKQAGCGGMMDAIECYILYFDSLRGKTKFEDAQEPFEQTVAKIEAKNDHFTASLCYILYLVEATLFNDFEKGFLAMNVLEKRHVRGTYAEILFHFHGILITLDKFKSATGLKRAKALKKVKKSLKRIDVFAVMSPKIFAHKADLCRAEIARFEGKTQRAMDLYEKAMQRANLLQIPKEIALIYERQAYLHMDLGHTQSAAYFLNRAWLVYKSWGAVRKTEQLVRNHPSLFFDAIVADNTTTTHQTTTSKFTTSSHFETSSLDLNAVLKVSQAIASEIKLEKLLEKVMKNVIENAGARKGCLLLKGEMEWKITAHAEADKHSHDLMIDLNQRPLTANILPVNLIQYVIGATKAVVLSNAAENSNFRRDPYIEKNQVKSVYALPLRNQGRLISILYLENDLLPDVFSEERQQLLELLSSQMAVSIENASFYNSLEEKVAERTAELEKRNQEILRTQNQLIMQEKMASLGMLTAGLAHELKNPLNFVNNFSEVSKQLVDEARETQSKDELEEIFTDLEDNLERIERNGKRADTIVASMMAFSREGGSWRSVKLTSLCQEYTKLSLNTIKTRFEQFDPQLEFHFHTEPLVEIQEQSLSRAIVCLATNAFEAIIEKQHQSGEGFQGKLICGLLEDEQHYLIYFEDNGPGIAEENQKTIFEPFFTTKPTGKGNIGLGLPITYDIVVQEHGGTLKLTETSGERTRFTIGLPKHLHA